MDKFMLQRCAALPEYNGEGRLYRHASGARVFWLANEDDNRVFSISFRTPPVDDTGLPHVLEHVALAGSQKFRMKEPFNELLKGTLHTYLNAMTYRAHTLYPVASCHPQELLKMTDVYLDAVFHPLFPERPESVWQEAWHWADTESAAPAISGVVYNEMLGAHSDPYKIAENVVFRALFPGSPLGFDAEGDPARIPQLTPEAVAAYHARHYCPANSFVYLYGDMDEEAMFIMLDAAFTSVPPGRQVALPMGKTPVKPVFAREDFAGANDMLAAGFVLGGTKSARKVQAWQALTDMLFTESALMHRALSPLGEGLSARLLADDGRVVLLVCLSKPRCSAAEFQAAIRSAAENAVAGGLAEMAENCLRRMAFAAREGDFGYKPRGLAAHVRMLPTWQSGGDLFAALSPLADMSALQRAAKNGLFEELLLDSIVRNGHAAFVTLSPGRQPKRVKWESLVLAKQKRFAQEEKRLFQYQSQPDSKRVLAAIPTLCLSAISRKADCLPVAVSDIGGTTVFTTPGENGIARARLMFSTNALQAAELPYLHVLAKMMRLSLEGRVGGYTAGFETLRMAEGGFAPYLTITLKTEKKQFADALAMAGEAITALCFDDAAGLHVLLQTCQTVMEKTLVTDALPFATRRAAGVHSPHARYADAAEGVECYRWLTELLADFDACAAGFCAELQRVSAGLFTRGNLRKIGLDGGADVALTRFVECFPIGICPQEKPAAVLPLFPQREHIATSARVWCNVFAADMRSTGFDYDGSLLAAAQIATQGWLTEQIRLRGGAYGCGAEFERTGMVRVYSFRDPEIDATYAAFDALAGELTRCNTGAAEMQKHILSAVNELDRPPRPGKRAETALLWRMAGYTDDAFRAERETLLSATAQDIRRAGDMLAALAPVGGRCTFGNV